jgi:AbiV family abortive infection protein
VEAGFRACLQNAQDLLLASQTLIAAKLHAPALSLAVLALEELGKLYTIDGLLYARPDDHKAIAFAKSGRSHSTKLDIFETFPLLLGNLGAADPRYGKERAYNQALVISISHLKDDGNTVLNKLETQMFAELDMWKQKGFYSEVADNRLLAPRDAIDPGFTNAVYHLAWRATTTLDFVLKGGNLERYISGARAIRATLSEDTHQELERLGREVFARMFPDHTDEGPLLAH